MARFELGQEVYSKQFGRGRIDQARYSEAGATYHVNFGYTAAWCQERELAAASKSEIEPAAASPK